MRDMGRLRWHLVKHLPKLPPGGEGAWTMRDVEHSLCEFDKYRRVQLDEGRPRSKYPGTTAEDWWAWNKKENELFDKEEAFYRKHFFKKG